MQGPSCFSKETTPRPVRAFKESIARTRWEKNRRNGGLKPFKDLHKEELKRECSARGLFCAGSKKELQEIFKEEIGGIQRVPAMIFFDQEKTMADLGLG